MKKLPWTWFDHRTDVPQWITSRIGQIAIEWSVLERELEQLVHLLTDADIGHARIVTSRMNARTRVSVIGYLIEWYVYHDQLKTDFLKRFVKLGTQITTKTQLKRDMVTHGLWSIVGRKWHVLRLAGQRPTPELRPDLEKLSRPLLPQKEAVTRDKLDEIIEQIVENAKSLHRLCDEIYHALSPAPSRYKPPPYSRRRRNSPKKKVPSSQPRSSRA
jgi:hypothetical protein